MDHTRRRTIGIAGLCAASAVVGPGVVLPVAASRDRTGGGERDVDGDRCRTRDADDAAPCDLTERDYVDENDAVEILEVDVISFALRMSTPAWASDEERRGTVAVIDSPRRELDVLGPLVDHVPDDRWPALYEWGADIDYGTERLFLIESVGPTGCHDTVEVDPADVTVADGRLCMHATVVDTSEPGTFCTQALVYPSTLVRVTFADEPVDSVAVALSDGWGTETTLRADAGDEVTALLESAR